MRFSEYYEEQRQTAARLVEAPPDRKKTVLLELAAVGLNTCVPNLAAAAQTVRRLDVYRRGDPRAAALHDALVQAQELVSFFSFYARLSVTTPPPHAAAA